MNEIQQKNQIRVSLVAFIFLIIDIVLYCVFIALLFKISDFKKLFSEFRIPLPFITGLVVQYGQISGIVFILLLFAAAMKACLKAQTITLKTSLILFFLLLSVNIVILASLFIPWLTNS